MTGCPAPRRCPVPEAWMRAGAPPEAMAAFTEGACPVHRTMLAPDMISRGGKGSLPRTWIEAGRCEACAADWHLGEYDGAVMLVATWDTGPAARLG